MLPILWKLYPECPYILPSYFVSGKLLNYVKKPILSREGANIEIIQNNCIAQITQGQYGKEGYIY